MAKRLAFDIADLKNEDGTIKTSGSAVIGSLDGSHDKSEVTLNGYIYNANAGGLGVAGWTADGGVASGKFYKYSGNTVTIA